MAENTSVVVHVWEMSLRNRSPGHASIELDGEYISFFPGECTSHTYQSRSLYDDVKHYQSKGQRHHAITLKGLNVFGMQIRWKLLALEQVCWSAAGTQCAELVLDLLNAGGAENCNSEWVKPLNWPSPRLLPEDLLGYVRGVKSGLDDTGGKCALPDVLRPPEAKR